MLENKRPENMERITTPALAEKFIAEQLEALRAQIGDGKVLLALSGGVDSSVVAALLIRAVGKQLVCVHVNHGLLRKGEPEQVGIPFDTPQELAAQMWADMNPENKVSLFVRYYDHKTGGWESVILNKHEEKEC